MYTRNGGGGQNQKFNKIFIVQCEYYKLKGDTVINLWGILKISERRRKRYNAAQNANVLTKNDNNQNQNLAAPTFTYGEY